MTGNEDQGEETVVVEESQHVDDHSHDSAMEKDAEDEVKKCEETNDVEPTEEAKDLDEHPEIDDEEQRELVIEDCTEDEDRMVRKMRKYEAWQGLVQLGHEADLNICTSLGVCRMTMK